MRRLTKSHHLQHARLFLTSKVRLHCDVSMMNPASSFGEPFPDLKGQAPLRPTAHEPHWRPCPCLFLTSKVRLHCDESIAQATPNTPAPFPDLKGQAPLRGPRQHPARHVQLPPFPDLKGQAPLRQDRSACSTRAAGKTFPDLKDQAPLRPPHPQHCSQQIRAFPDLKGQTPLRPGAVPCWDTDTPHLFLTSKVRLHCDK